MGRLGLRTPRDISAAARWTVAEPKGWAFFLTRAAACAVLVSAGARWHNWGWLAGVVAYGVAALAAPGPRDLDTQPPPRREPPAVGASSGMLPPE